MDFSLSSSNGKAVHLVATDSISDLSTYSIRVAANGSSNFSSSVYTFPQMSVNTGDDILVARSLIAMQSYFDVCYSAFEHALLALNSITQNGDDVIGLFLGLMLGLFSSWFLFWLHLGRYRAKLQPYLSPGQVLWHYTFRVICGIIFLFLITPILVVMPLSFNAQDFFTFTPEMLRFDPDGYSLKHYRDFFTNNEWQRSFKNSLLIAPVATIVSVSLGTLAAIGLSQSHVPFKLSLIHI